MREWLKIIIDGLVHADKAQFVRVEIPKIDERNETIIIFGSPKTFPNTMIAATNHDQLHSLLKWLKIVVECHDIKLYHRRLTSFGWR